MEQFFEEAFKMVFSGAADSCKFQQGFEDAIAGIKPQSDERNYTNGYSVGGQYANNDTRETV